MPKPGHNRRKKNTGPRPRNKGRATDQQLSELIQLLKKHRIHGQLKFRPNRALSQE